ncbi:NAD(P)(+) transhydrogenase (Re/Si-specific) subunit beta [Candidatus Darwinibacter acetoxidans]
MLSPFLVVQILCIGLFIYGIRLMNSPETAVTGNLVGAVGMAGAIIMTMVEAQVLTMGVVWAGLLVGTALGVWLSAAVKMIQMPQMVALFNGFGGAASFLVATLTLLEGGLTPFTLFTSALAIVVGGVTFSGSLVAAGKLHGVLHQRPVHLKGHNSYLFVSAAIMVLSTLGLVFQVGSVVLHALLLLVFSHVFGYVFTIRVGGADMPITISLLNSFSGVAGSVAGFALPNGALLVVVGSIVGASGLILTQIMCRAMNRHLMDILLGKTTMQPGAKPAPQAPQAEQPKHEAAKPQGPSWEERLRSAKKVAIIPGYGMALAQAQLQVKQLGELLESRGAEVRFGIHPVAGRMPGHMNVLLAEVDVPYEKLCELDDINAFLEGADVAIIVGANDVVNPAAIELPDTPIYGMPIVRADLAEQVLVCNYDTKPGYAGVDNSLYNLEKVHMLLGDAKDSLAQLLEIVKGEEDAPAAPAAPEAAPAKDPAALLKSAQRVVIVPGYGMALAQAQGQVKMLVELLQSAGKQVEIAVHPVAGRMPGHMNVLMAEVDIPYELLLEMDQINHQFPEVDVVVVVGANDVINPAANTHEGTPIYGMPVLNVVEAKSVIIYNLDRSPGYAGVENTLYDMDHCVFVPGDAAASLQALVQALKIAG